MNLSFDTKFPSFSLRVFLKECLKSPGTTILFLFEVVLRDPCLLNMHYIFMHRSIWLFSTLQGSKLWYPQFILQDTSTGSPLGIAMLSYMSAYRLPSFSLSASPLLVHVWMQQHLISTWQRYKFYSYHSHNKKSFACHVVRVPRYSSQQFDQLLCYCISKWIVITDWGH